MSVLLYVPGLLVILFQRHGALRTALSAVALAGTQLLAGAPFLRAHPREYLAAAYELSRAFLYEWTVNWRFVPEHVFRGRAWATALLAGHVGALVLFGLRAWCARAPGGVWDVLWRGLRAPLRAPVRGALSADCECFRSDRPAGEMRAQARSAQTSSRSCTRRT